MDKITFEKIPALSAGERLVFYVDVGNMPMHKAKEYLKHIMDSFNTAKLHTPDTQEYFVPVRNGIKSVEVKVESLASVLEGIGAGLA
jgi:hypothetical protein